MIAACAAVFARTIDTPALAHRSRPLQPRRSVDIAKSSHTLEVKVGPPQLTVHQGYTVMVSEPDGQILAVGQKGLYFLDTRLISSWAMFADGAQWKLLNGGALAASAAQVYCTNPPVLTSAGNDTRE